MILYSLVVIKKANFTLAFFIVYSQSHIFLIYAKNDQTQ